MAASSQKCFCLDSAGSTGPAFSYFGTNPFLELKLEGDRLKLSGAESGTFSARKLFQVLRRLFKKYRSLREPKTGFFTGGAVGFLGYEMARFFEKVRFRRKPGPGTPDLYFGFYDEVVIYDHRKQVYYLAARAKNKKQAGLKIQKLQSFMSSPNGLVGGGNSRNAGDFRLKKFVPEISRRQFESMVRRAKTYIRDGDIYQANLSQRFSFSFQGKVRASDLRLYAKLRKINPSPFASFLRAGTLSIISSSPERLVSKKGDDCETRPIAGTRPRRPGLERRASAELLASPKERAEHIMLVDLERNDLGRVCDYQSVRMEEMMGIEKYSHVLHIVSKITGKLSRGKDGWDLVRAMFPGGTITGCPKVRCMEIIDQLEPVQRGLYTGSIGYFGFNGDLDLNIIIRTLVLQKNRGYFQVGAGIVHDSEPAKEYEETLHKGEAMIEALASHKQVPHRGFQGMTPTMRPFKG